MPSFLQSFGKLFRCRSKKETNNELHILSLMQQMANQINHIEMQISQMSARVGHIEGESAALKKMMWLVQTPGKDLASVRKHFWESYPKAKGFLRSMQECSLCLLEDFQKICEQNDLQFWLHGGTLIGAIRHHGFIPWDDDIDVAILRKDFEKIRQILKDSPLVIQEFYNDLCCSKGYQVKYKDQTIPVFLDLVIYDFTTVMPNTLDNRSAYLEKFRMVRRELLHEFRHESQTMTFIPSEYHHFGSYSEQDKEHINHLFERKNRQLNISSTGNVLFYALENYPFPYPVLPDTEVFPLKQVQFERLTLLMPKNAEKYLDGYKDIWEIPSDIGVNNHKYAFAPYEKEIEEFLEKRRKK